jgi:UDP-N-acetyl-2-amino-2-deoxyglucuronate dehydrogenase
MEKRFAIIGAGGFIAPRHLKAIKEVGGRLVAAVDKSDSLGILDKYFPDAEVFTEIERFERFLEKSKHKGKPVDYVVVCTPNYLHDSHIRLGLRAGANVICEKPIVLNPWNVEELKKIEKESGKKVYSVLQLRLHPEIKQLMKKYGKTTGHLVQIDYLTPRGKWYKQSWKNDVEKSGGLLTNIGVHLFDMLVWIFGEDTSSSINSAWSHDDTIFGRSFLKRAIVDWKLSIDVDNVPLRYLKIDNEIIDFTQGFEDLHTEVYKDILKGGGFGLDDCLPSIQLVSKLR